MFKETQFKLLDTDNLKLVRPVTSTGIFVSSSKEFDPDGFFSTEIFGEIGSSTRTTSLSYISLKTDVIHPLVYTQLIKASRLIGKILEGTAYATFSKKTGSFTQTEDSSAGTGFRFVIENLPYLKLEDTGSTSRQYVIKLLKKYKNNLLMDKQIVIPAGIRDFTVGSDGRSKKDPINDIYRKILSTTFIIPGKHSIDPSLNSAFVTMQKGVVEHYDYVLNLLLGKQKVFNKQFLKRRIQSRVGLPATLTLDTSKHKDDKALGINDVSIGVTSFLSGAIARVPYTLRNSKLADALPDKLSSVLVIDSDKRQVILDPDPDLYEGYMEIDGISKTIKSFMNKEALMDNMSITVGSNTYHLLMKYEHKGKVGLVSSTDLGMLSQEIVESLEPVTKLEFYYITLSDIKAESTVTRYPAIELGSSLVLTPLIRPTVVTRKMELLNMQDGTTIKTLWFYPVLDSAPYLSASVHPGRFKGLGLDVDGDTLHVSIMLSDESLKEIKDFKKKATSYKHTNRGRMRSNLNVEPLDVIAKFMVE